MFKKGDLIIFDIKGLEKEDYTNESTVEFDGFNYPVDQIWEVEKYDCGIILLKDDPYRKSENANGTLDDGLDESLFRHATAIEVARWKLKHQK